MTSYDTRPHIVFPSAIPIASRVSAFLSAVYGWMCAGLAITAVAAWFIAGSPTLVRAIATNRARIAFRIASPRFLIVAKS